MTSHIQTYINFLHSKLSITMDVMFKTKHYSPKHYQLTAFVHYTLFHPHLIYCITAWSSVFSANLNPLRTFRNKAIKILN